MWKPIKFLFVFCLLLSNLAILKNSYALSENHKIQTEVQIKKEELLITIVGSKEDPKALALYQAASAYPAENKRIEWIAKGEKSSSSEITYPHLDRSAAYVCTHGLCSTPAFTPHDLTEMIDQLITQASLPTFVKAPPLTLKEGPLVSVPDRVTRLLKGQNIFFIIFGFFGMGLLLAFTPCMLPMLPILASIIVGEGKKITLYRAFTLSLTYVLAMATTYAIAGVIAAILGSYLQAYLQSPLILSLFSLVFVLLALSLFGFYDLSLPRPLHLYITKASNWYANETYIGVAMMGFLATLIASPCVTAPLAGVLGYISQTGDATFGGLALFMLGTGMGAPLIIVGTIGGKFLPKSGPWLNGVKAFFGLILLGVAIWLLDRILPSLVIMLLCSMLAMFTAVYMGAFDRTPVSRIGKFWKGLSLIILAYGFALTIGGFMGNTDPLKPLQIRKSENSSPNNHQFQPVKNLAELQGILKRSRYEQRITLLDFYADWCISCKRIETHVFGNKEVQSALTPIVLLRADITNNTTADLELTKYFNVIAPPTILFFDKNGKEIAFRIVGEVDAKEFLNGLQQVLAYQQKESLA
jgi:thiol:disulfide interchange protein DsbD